MVHNLWKIQNVHKETFAEKMETNREPTDAVAYSELTKNVFRFFEVVEN